MRRFILGFFAVIAFSISSCGGGSTTVQATGTLGGAITVSGAIINMANLTVGIFTPGTTTALEEAVLGNNTSGVTGDYTDRSITFSFTNLALGSYEIAVYNSDSEYYRSESISLTTTNPTNISFSDQMSFSGKEPWGTISGYIDLGETAWPTPSTTYTYLGFRNGSEAPRLQYPVTEGMPTDGYVDHNQQTGRITFNMDFLVYGSWTVGLYGYNYNTHQVTVFGEFDNEVLIHGQNPNATAINFPADFGGDPGEDPVLGSINGTITFNGALPTGLYIAVGATTIPPTAGAPVAHMDVTPEMVQGSTVDYTLSSVPYGTYGVSIFSYDMSTHSVTYFGEYSESVTVDETTPNVNDIDFNADVTVLQ